MKIKQLILMLSGVTLLLPAYLTGCDQRSSNLPVTQGERPQAAAPGPGVYAIYTREGSLLEIYGNPAAGPGQEEGALPASILHYFLIRSGSVTGLVWDDRNGNNLPDADESGMEGISVYLDADLSETYSDTDPSQLTDASGMYTFPRVSPGASNFYIDPDSLPAGYVVTTSHPLAVNVAKKQGVRNADFGIQAQEGTATLDGTIWDRTANAPITGVRIFVDLNTDDKFSANEPNGSTDGKGFYSISQIPNGTFRVRVDNTTLDAKYHRTPVMGANPTSVTIQAGATLTVNYTYILKATVCGSLQDSSGKIWGNVTVFIDMNGNGTFDAGEPMTVTDGSGRFCFDELMPDEYTLRLLNSPFGDGYIIGAPGLITVGEGDEFSNATFTIQAKPVAISGFVWDDANGNGAKDASEKGIAGVTVFLDANNNGSFEGSEPATVTDETGALLFDGLMHGDYYIRTADANLTSKYILTTAANPLYRVIAPGQTFDGARFGYQRKLAPVNTPSTPTRLTWGSDGSLYVSDNTIGSVFIYDSALALQGELKGLAKPLGVAVDGAGNIYVGSQERKNVEIYDPDGNLLRSLGDGQLLTPNDMAIDRDNNIYILDSSNDRVQVYDPEGNLIATIGSSQQFKYPVSIAISYRDDGSGNQVGELAVADQASCAIHLFSLNGTLSRSIGTCGTMYTTNWDGLFTGLVSVDFDRAGNIHGLDNNLNVVQVFDRTTGAFLRSYNAYLPENAARVNLQTDMSINPADSRVVVSKFEAMGIETVATVPTP